MPVFTPAPWSDLQRDDGRQHLADAGNAVEERPGVGLLHRLQQSRFQLLDHVAERLDHGDVGVDAKGGIVRQRELFLKTNNAAPFLIASRATSAAFTPAVMVSSKRIGDIHSI